MKHRVSEVVKDAVEPMGVLLKPIDVTRRKIGGEPGMIHSILVHDQVDFVMARQLGQELDTRGHRWASGSQTSSNQRCRRSGLRAAGRWVDAGFLQHPEVFENV